MSPSENIDNLFFKKRGVLWDEFDNLYRTLFSNSQNYIKIVEALFTKKEGLNRTELVSQTKLADNAAFTRILENLSDSGFIRSYNMFGNKRKGTVYQLRDYYTMFYLRFVKDNYGKDEEFWSHHLDHPSRRAWAGLTFEMLCKDHLNQIKRGLSILGVSSEVSVWKTLPTEENNGAQVDLIIDRRDRVIDICEMKFSENEFSIDKEYAENLRNKMDVFRIVTGTKRQFSWFSSHHTDLNKTCIHPGFRVRLRWMIYSKGRESNTWNGLQKQDFIKSMPAEQARRRLEYRMCNSHQIMPILPQLLDNRLIWCLGQRCWQ